jgi:hypothetical protein
MLGCLGKVLPITAMRSPSHRMIWTRFMISLKDGIMKVDIAMKNPALESVLRCETIVIVAELIVHIC